jgi:erythrocyte band 7 integral membrane protein
VLYAPTIRFLHSFHSDKNQIFIPRIVVFRSGHSRFGREPVGAGLYWVLPFIDNHRIVDLRTATIDLPMQKLLTKDSLAITVDAVVYIHVLDAARSVMNVRDARKSTMMLAQTTLRNVLGTKDLLEILAHRDEIGREIRIIVDEATDPWGICVERVELTDLLLPQNLERAMAAEAEAKREAQAKIIAAKGEMESAKALRDASITMAESPGALQLRFFQTLHSISAEKNSTIVLPFPMELTSPGNPIGVQGVNPAIAPIAGALAKHIPTSF